MGAFRRANVVLLALALLGIVSVSACDSGPERAQSYYDHGVELAANGEPAKAALEFRNALRLKGDFAEARFALGQAEERLGNFESAYRAYSALAEQDPTHIQARIRLATILLAAGQLDAALDFADQALEIDGTDASALTTKAAIELKLDNRGDAVRLARAALEQNPEYVDASVVLASERLLASDPAGALEFLDRAKGDTDQNLGLQILRLAALDALNDQPGVEQLFDKLLELFPNTPAFREGQIRWYLSKGREADAERVMRQYAADNPDNDQVQLNLIAFLNSQKGAAAAIAELEAIISGRDDADGANFDLRMALAQLKFADDQHAEATALVQSIISGTTDNDKRNQARILLARMAVATDDSAQAEQLTEAVLADDASNVEALGIRASIRLSGGDVASAIDDLIAALNEAPDSARLHSLLAQAYESNGSAALAEEQYAKALALDKNSPETGLPMARFLLSYGKADQARRVLEAVRQTAPNDRQVLTLLAQLRLATQDWVGAQEIANKLRQLDQASGGEPETTADRIAAAALRGLNRYGESIDLLQTALSDPASRQAVLPDLIQAYMQAGREQAAETYLKTVIEDDPTNVQARILLGSVYMAAGSQDEAQGAFQQAAEADTGVIGQLALAQFFLTTGKLPEAESAARAGLERDSENVALRLLLAAVFEQMQRFDEAIAEYDILFAADSNATIVANDLASLLSERRGDEESLSRAFEIAQRFRNSEIPQYLDTLGWIYYLRGEYASALPLLKTAAERLPGVALIQFHYGMALKQLGQPELATESLERSIEATPPLIDADLEKARQALAELQAPDSPPAEPSE